jgi:hypothetical protein
MQKTEPQAPTEADLVRETRATILAYRRIARLPEVVEAVDAILQRDWETCDALLEAFAPWMDRESRWREMLERIAPTPPWAPRR